MSELKSLLTSSWSVIAVGFCLAISSCGDTDNGGDAFEPVASANAGALIDVGASLFPVNAAEWEDPRTSTWATFQSEIVRQRKNVCLAGKGYPEAVLDNKTRSNDPRGSSAIEFPNVKRLKSGYLSVETHPAGPIGQSNPSEKFPGLDGDSLACGIEARKPFEAVAKIEGELINDYFEITTQVDTYPSVVAARRKLIECINAGGVDARTIDEFFGQVDRILLGQVERGDPKPGAPELAKLYGTCVEPLADIQEDIRRSKRGEYFDTHAAKITQYQAEVAKTVEELSNKYGVKFGE